jgi:2,3-bisphosphoglycerate-dependent phosphoglycerate mutase
MTSTLILLRHGQSTWNAENLFTGWWDADLSEQGRKEATAAGELMANAGLAPHVVHTSLQTRAIRTADLALDAMDMLWLPVRRHWRLNERHYGDLTGRDKAEATAQFGEDQVHVWRRSYDVPPPPTSDGNRYDANADARYASVPPDVMPRSECLADVVARMLPYWFDVIVPDLAGDRTVLVAAHGNSLRALVKHLDRISDDDIARLNVPTGVPLVYPLDGDARPADATADVLDRALGDPAAIRAAADAVAHQATAGTDDPTTDPTETDTHDTASTVSTAGTDSTNEEAR